VGGWHRLTLLNAYNSGVVSNTSSSLAGHALSLPFFRATVLQSTVVQYCFVEW